MDLLKLIQKLPSAPPFFNEVIMDKFGVRVSIPYTAFPNAAFASKRQDANGKSLPQVIAHRGHKATYPENTIAAFVDAVEAGAHALETDLHLSKDGVVVLSHDPDLKRCFGVNMKIKDCTWDFLSTLKTSKPPHEPLARLRDLLELFLQRRRGWDSIWLLLDVKFSDDPKELVPRIRETFEQVHPVGSTSLSFWKERVVLGYWTAAYIPLYHLYLPTIPIMNIGFSPSYTRQFLTTIPTTSFGLMHATLLSPSGRRLIRDIRVASTYQDRANNNNILSWTVNDTANIEWCMERGLDGIITDEVPRVLEMCEKWSGKKGRSSWGGYYFDYYYYWWSNLDVNTVLGLIRVNFWIWLWGVVFRRRYGGTGVLDAGRQVDRKSKKDT